MNTVRYDPTEDQEFDFVTTVMGRKLRLIGVHSDGFDVVNEIWDLDSGGQYVRWDVPSRGSPPDDVVEFEAGIFKAVVNHWFSQSN